MFDDRAYINPQTITSYCNTNEDWLSDGPVRAIIVELPGLGGSSCLGGSINMGKYASDFTLRCAANGIVVAYMFPGPWSWGNKVTTRMTDAVVTAIAEKYSMPKDFPLAVCGGSMGGLGALNYAADTGYQRNLVGVVSACPCIDVLDRFTASASYARSFISAVAAYDMSLDDALKAISPAHKLDSMPDVPYFICSDAEDEVFPEEQCDQYAADLSKRVGFVDYRKQPGLKHGQFTAKVKNDLHDFLVEKCLRGEKEKIGSFADEENAVKLLRAKVINELEIELSFSEPISIDGTPFMAIRFTGDSGIGVFSTVINGKNQPLQFSGSIRFSDEKHESIIWRLDTDNLASADTVYKILNREGVLYGIENQVRFCIEEVPNNPEGKNKIFGHIDNVSSAADPSKYLLADNVTTGWEGKYVDIEA